MWIDEILAQSIFYFRYIVNGCKRSFFSKKREGIRCLLFWFVGVKFNDYKLYNYAM